MNDKRSAMLARRFLIGWICVALPGWGISAGAEEDFDSGIIEERNGERAAFEEQTSLIIDRTITLFGNEFYRNFVEAWRSVQGVAKGDLGIIERPSARWGSLVWIEHNNQQLYRAFLYPGRRADVRPIAEDAARYIAARLMEGELASALFKDPDVGKEEF
jgi:curli production assembly/transport component CsgE